MSRSLDDILRTHRHLCWYPSANADFRGLLYLSDRYFEWKKLSRDEGQCLPDLFLMTDIGPHDSTDYKGGNLYKKENGFSQISYLTDGRWRKLEVLYRGLRILNHEGEKRRRNEAKWKMVTEIRVSYIERLADLSLEFCPELFRECRSQKPAYYGNAFYIRAHVTSVQREETPEPKRYEYDCEIVYVLADNTSFARDYLMKRRISAEYVIQIRYGDSMGGGSAVPGSWLGLMLDQLNCRYFMANPRYAEAADAAVLPEVLREFFRGYPMRTVSFDQIASLRDHRYCCYSDQTEFDDINLYRITAQGG